VSSDLGAQESAEGGTSFGRFGSGGSTGSRKTAGTSGVLDLHASDAELSAQGRAILLRQLALGPRSRHQLSIKLAQRDIPPGIATALLDRFEEVQLIDDAEFARMWVRTRTAAKSLSRFSLRRELADKGIAPELAEDALLQTSDEEEDDRAREVVRRKIRDSTNLSDRAAREKEVRRLVGVLARKGYSPGLAFGIVKDVLADIDVPD